MIKVTVPATSANLAVGFDCVGIAVTMHSSFLFSENETEHLSISGCPAEFQNEDNLVYQGFKAACDFLGEPVPNVHIEINSKVPVSRGLGSSAVCIVGGLAGANQWFDNPLTDQQLLEIATEMEGHPDNVAPAIYGGLCMAFIDSHSQVQVVKYPVNRHYQFTAIIPDFKISTADARRVLPKQMSYADVTHQVSHSLLMTRAIETGNIDQLHTAMNDRMHEPYRQQLIHHFPEVKSLCNHSDAVLYVSGSGSTMMAITNDSDNQEQLISSIQSKFPQWSVHAVSVDNNGFKSEVLSDREILHY
ncbi:homoserine kinase (plasmid) [Nicoliella spurrieriana]|uniref:Homoserine kinase n=1 Tax=Nicoliella spurrieriana TaxID=2925830 RepID=A0A976X4X3_9LACO|nr:homoserine kinase [Nicoliella spurrieriana]UQS86204.1 homoserine kinase [Nicoliella spurrieriana]